MLNLTVGSSVGHCMLLDYVWVLYLVLLSHSINLVFKGDPGSWWLMIGWPSKALLQQCDGDGQSQGHLKVVFEGLKR